MGRTLTLAVACALLALPGTAAAANSDRVHGTGEFGLNRFEVEAQGTPTDGKGHVYVFDNDAKAAYKADVICVRAVGNRATILGKVNMLRNPGLSIFENGGVLVEVEDNGKDQQNPTDRWGNFLYIQSQFASFGGVCPGYLPRTQPTVIRKGDITVDDVQ